MANFRFTVGRKIGMGFGILIFFTLVAFILTQVTLNESRKKTRLVTDVYTPSVSLLKELNLMVVRSKMLIYNWVFIQSADDNPNKQKLRKLINKEYPELKTRILTYSVKWNNKAEQTSMDSIFTLIDKLFVTDNSVMGQLHSFATYNDPSVMFIVRPVVEDGDVDIKTKQILNDLSKLIDIERANATQVTNEMLNSFQLLQLVVRGLGLALLIGGILIAFFTVRTIVPPVQQLKRMLLSMGRGVLPNENIRARNDEIGEMSVAMKGLIKGLRSTTEFAREVGSGNFESEYKPLSEEDTLGHALLKMRVDLRENERVLEAKVIERTEEVVRQKEEIETQNQKLEVLYKHVTDSIKYAKRLQEAILPQRRLVEKILPNSFVLYKPKDIVSGDFYWISEKNNKTLFSAVDCTGHGVPGAFMSIVAHNLLKHVISEVAKPEPALILDKLNKGVHETLHQGIDEAAAKDGMDLAFCTIDYKKMELEYAGAFNPLYLVRNGELEQIKADKFPIGFFVGEEKKNFTNHKVKLQKGDCVYIFSDGYADQFGGPNGKKFMAKNFRDVLLNVHKYPVDDQKEILDRTIEEWKGALDQVDDILVIGVKL